ncbi:SseB family protein [Thioalbus denitrificans]|jgi:hypothetical protein|uniref:Type III secretion system (T3SS) SseB-like protein n=1 Tax=Thioalbus denitrificans TaxID=547122 RepID=A0A369BV78_9GAMM|nr:SseB family protein [Thioalbus denitrificans]RCX24905.1 type III secretion system (T3SS) SseB-like protein [Thioalbus denitrificans]
MSERFEPHNDLERALLDAQEGRLAEDAFMATLLQSQVFLPIYDKTRIGGFQDSRSAQPLTLKDADGQEVVVIFTSPERAKPFVADYPGYGGGLLAEFSWVLEKLGAGVALSLNPGSEVGIDMEADMVAALSQQSGGPVN